MSNTADVVEELRRFRSKETAVELALRIADKEGKFTSGRIIIVLKTAFPDMPLRALLESGAWCRVGGPMSDEAFNDHLGRWLGPKSPQE